MSGRTRRLEPAYAGVIAVLVASGPVLAAPADLRPKDAEPFQVAVPTFNQSAGAKLYTVPDGKRAVIEYVSATCSDMKRVAAAVLQTSAAGVTAPHLIAMQPSGGGTFTGAQHLRAYADQGTYVWMMARNYESGTYTCFDGAISGYLVDAP
jgi:hypothetical protein